MRLGREHTRQGARKMANNVSSSAERTGQDTDRKNARLLPSVRKL